MRQISVVGEQDREQQRGRKEKRDSRMSQFLKAPPRPVGAQGTDLMGLWR